MGIFEGANHAAIYAMYRPIPPTKLIDRIILYFREKSTLDLDLCLDVGCGNGQGSQLFAPHFKRVIATDISSSQIQIAKSLDQPKNIEFKACPAEEIPTESNTVQIVSAIQACHWFDLPAFFKEVGRVLCNNGVVALAGYDVPTIVHPTKSEQLTEHLKSFHHVTLFSFYGPGYTLLKNNYRGISVPFKDCVQEDIWTDEQTVTLSFLVKEFTTTSAYQNFCTARGETAGENLLKEFIRTFQAIIESEEHPDRLEFQMKYRYFVIMGRKTVN